jgi:putative superfamily III holin-X
MTVASDYRTEPRSEPRQRSTAELLGELIEQVGTLARQEVELAKAEMAVKAKRAGTAAGELAGAGVLALGAFGALTACFIAALALRLPVWAAALIVAVVYAVIGAALAFDARGRLRGMSPAPEETVESIKEDVRWARRQTS